MKKNLSGFISILLCLMLVWSLIPMTAFAGGEEELTVSWGDNADGYFMAASDEADFGDVYRSCPFVTRKFDFYWSQDENPDHTEGDVIVTAPPVMDSFFRMEADGNQLTVTPDKDMLPEADGTYTETAVVYLSLGEYDTAERKQEIELTFTMNLKDGDPVFEINNADDLMSFATLVNAGYTDIDAVLASDITLNEELFDEEGKLTDDTEDLISWIPIGSSADTAFEGEFDGCGFTISGLYMDSEDAFGGLFGVLKGTAENIRIEDSWIESKGNAAAFAAWNQGTIQNASSDAYVTAAGVAGGIAGLNEGEIIRCYTTGTAVLSEGDEDTPGGDAPAAGPVSGISSGSVDKVFYLADEESDDIDGTQAMNADQLASGELCWLLNEGLDEPVFFQDLGDDEAPVLYDTHLNVYRGYESCADTEPIYANEALPEERPAHALSAHEGIDASCGEAGSSAYWSCEICGRFFADAEGITEIEDGSWIIPAAPHVLTGHEAVPPTCTEGGSSAYWSCEICGRFFADAEGTSEIADGAWILPAAGHTLTEHAATESSCAAGGNTAYWSCDTCGKFFADADAVTEIADGSWILPTAPHTLTAHEAVTPTCTEGGSNAYWSCDICGRFFADADAVTEIADGSWILPAAPHTLTGHDAVAPTCTEGGSNAYWSCDICGRFFADAEGTSEIAEGGWILPAAGHTLTGHGATAATCAAEGNHAYWSCELCGKYFLDQEGNTEIEEGSWIIEKTLHKLTAHEAVEPSCTEGGNSAYWSCEVCGRFFSDEAGTAEIADGSWLLPAAGHTLTAHEALSPTCTEGGSSAYWSCEVCGKYFGDEAGTAEIEKDSWLLPAAGHTLTAHEAVAATCAAEGSSAYWSCELCGKFFSDEDGSKEIAEGSWVIAKTAHQLTAHEAVEPGCTEGGNSAYWSCELCGKFFSDEAGTAEIADGSWILPAAGHKLTAHEAVSPICTEGGSSAYWSCDTCGKFFGDEAGSAEIEKDSWLLPAAGHTLTAHEAVAATCAMEGSSAYWSCEACGKFFGDEAGTTEIEKDSWILDKTAHTLTAHEAVEPSCTEGGSSAYWSCDVCGKYFADEEGSEEIEQDSWILPAAGHQLTEHEAAIQTCTEGGSTAYWSCDVCGKYFADEEGTEEIEENSWILPASPHTLTAHEAVEPGCTEDGNTAYWSCDVCGMFFGDEAGTAEIEKDSWILEKTGHTLAAHEAVEATCTEGGSSAYWFCETCGKYFADEEGSEEIEEDSWILPAAGHELSEHEAAEPTCTEDGSSAYWSCEVCGKYFADEEGTEEIEENSWILPALSHTLTAHEAKEANCTEEGNTAYWSCDACGLFFSDEAGTEEIEEDSWILPALGHDFVDGICSRCGEEDETEPETQPTSVEPESEAPPTIPPVPSKDETQPVPVTVPESDTDSPTAPTEYLISVSDDGHGKASASPAFATSGVTVTLTAKPNDGYRFKEWQVLSGGVKISGNKFTVGSDNVEIKALFEKIPATPPSIIGGNGGVWTEGSKTGITMTCDGDYFSFTDLKVDGSVVAKKNYTVSAGSVIVDLKPEYLNTLAEGEHKLSFVFGKLESDEGRFTVAAHEEKPVRKVNVILWIIIAAACLGLIASIIILLVGKKKTREDAEITEEGTDAETEAGTEAEMEAEPEAIEVKKTDNPYVQ